MASTDTVHELVIQPGLCDLRHQPRLPKLMLFRLITRFQKKCEM
jgi:hypothetical protein